MHLSIPLAAATLTAAQAHTGPLALAVAHSYGAASLVQALHHGLDVARVVLLAAPTHYGTFARRAALQGGVPAQLIEPLMRQLEGLIGVHPDAIDMVSQARSLAHATSPAASFGRRPHRAASGFGTGGSGVARGTVVSIGRLGAFQGADRRRCAGTRASVCSPMST